MPSQLINLLMKFKKPILKKTLKITRSNQRVIQYNKLVRPISYGTTVVMLNIKKKIIINNYLYPFIICYNNGD